MNRRAEIVIEALAVDPASSVNAACQGWAETEAAYRFFNNNLVTPEKILKPHRDFPGDAAAPLPCGLCDSCESGPQLARS